MFFESHVEAVKAGRIVDGKRNAAVNFPKIQKH